MTTVARNMHRGGAINKYLPGGVFGRLIKSLLKSGKKDPYIESLRRGIKEEKRLTKKALLAGKDYGPYMELAHLIRQGKVPAGRWMTPDEVVSLLPSKPYLKLWHPETGQLLTWQEYLNANPAFKGKVEIGVDPKKFWDKYHSQYGPFTIEESVDFK